MSKLKFDRLIDLNIRSSEIAQVPEGELWKGRFYGIDSITDVTVNGEKVEGSNPDVICVAGASIRVRPFNNIDTASLVLQGIAFKVVENV